MTRASKRMGTKTIGGSRQAARKAQYIAWLNRYGANPKGK